MFGGTFDPVHFGHLRSARALLGAGPVRELRFMPAARPPHRGAPSVAAQHRALMLEAAIADEPRFACDRRELRRSGPSFMVDSLRELRTELGPFTSIALVLGCDAFLGLPTWHRWRDLRSYAHLIILARPGWDFPAHGELREYMAAHQASLASLADLPSGGLSRVDLPPQDVSATRVRALLQSGQSAQGLVPDVVLRYIEEHGLYRD